MPRMDRTPQVTTTHVGPVFSVERIEFADADGRTVCKDVVRHPGAVTIIGIRDDGCLLLIRNTRIAVNEALLELPAGKLEPEEDAADAARRELEEETGYRPASVEALGTFFTTPGFSDELMHVFLATDLTAVGQRLEPGELIEVEPVDPAEVPSLISGGRLRDGKTIAAWAMWTIRAGGREIA